MKIYLYLLTIFSFLSSLRSSLHQSKFYLTLSWLIRIIVVLNFILGTGILIYFTDFVNPFNITISLYYDILKTYFDNLKRFYNDLIKFNLEDSIISNVKESNNIKNQIKGGIKEGVIEALDGIMDELEEKIKTKTDLIKNIALTGSVLFFGYF